MTWLLIFTVITVNGVTINGQKEVRDEETCQIARALTTIYFSSKEDVKSFDVICSPN